ncbi:MAG: hypothetical protein K1X88_15240 [Nannocystaceae bacterium]|nr:hypothetical protein [Nannocystaceae bacterium]
MVDAPSRLRARVREVEAGVQPGLAAFVDQLPEGGRVWVGRMAGNGDREVLVYVPPGARDDAAFEIIVHFHGTHSEHVQAKAPGLPKKTWVGWNRLQQTLDAATALQTQRGTNVALVYPVSAGKRPDPGHTGWWNKEYDRVWMRPGVDAAQRKRDHDSFPQLLDEVRTLLRERFGVHESKLPARVLAEGHSAGGIALFNIAAVAQAAGEPAAVSEYLFLDASFQGWADGCWAAIQAGKQDAKVSIVVTKGGIADPFGKSDPWCTRLEQAAAQWSTLAGHCHGKHQGRSCAELEADATAWPDFQAWCDAMKDEMRAVDGVYVHTTRVPHGEQPRHFVGGLELPDDRR